MKTERDQIICLFDKDIDAQNAIDELQREGYSPKEISFMAREGWKSKQKESATPGKVAAGATTGAVAGAAIGGLAGLAAGAIAMAIPGIGPALVAGPLAMSLGTTGAATGAAAGGAIGGLAGFGMSKEKVDVYQERVRDGDILVGVHAMEHNKKEVVDILKDNNAEEIGYFRPKHHDFISLGEEGAEVF